MALNKLSDLNNHLFAQLERLGDENLSEEKLQHELARAKGINDVAENVVMNARLMLDARVKIAECVGPGVLPKLLE